MKNRREPSGSGIKKLRHCYYTPSPIISTSLVAVDFQHSPVSFSGFKLAATQILPEPTCRSIYTHARDRLHGGLEHPLQSPISFKNSTLILVHPTKCAYTGSQINSPGISPGTSKLFPLDPVTIQERGEKWRRQGMEEASLKSKQETSYTEQDITS